MQVTNLDYLGHMPVHDQQNHSYVEILEQGVRRVRARIEHKASDNQPQDHEQEPSYDPRRYIVFLALMSEHHK